MDTALPQKFPFILDRNLAKANCTENRVCTACDKVVLAQGINFWISFYFLQKLDLSVFADLEKFQPWYLRSELGSHETYSFMDGLSWLMKFALNENKWVFMILMRSTCVFQFCSKAWMSFCSRKFLSGVARGGLHLFAMWRSIKAQKSLLRFEILPKTYLLLGW